MTTWRPPKIDRRTIEQRTKDTQINVTRLIARRALDVCVSCHQEHTRHKCNYYSTLNHFLLDLDAQVARWQPRWFYMMLKSDRFEPWCQQCDELYGDPQLKNAAERKSKVAWRKLEKWKKLTRVRTTAIKRSAMSEWHRIRWTRGVK